MKKTILLISFFITIVYSQQEWTTYSNFNYIKDIATNGRYIYAATTGGLLRIDTLNFTRTYYTNNNGLPSINCNTVAIGKGNDLWIGCNDGSLVKYNNNSNKFINYSNYKQYNWEIKSIIYHKNYLIIASNKGVSLFSLDNYKAEKNFIQFDTLTSKSVLDIEIISDTLFVLLSEPQLRTSPSLFSFNDYKNIVMKNVIAYVKIDWNNLSAINLDDPQVWKLTEAPAIMSMCKYSNRLIKSSRTDIGVANNAVYETWEGLYKNNAPVTLEGISINKLSKSNFILTSFAKDSSNRIWIGTAGSGIIYSNKSQWGILSHEGPAVNVPANILNVYRDDAGLCLSQFITSDNSEAIWISSGSPPLYNSSGKGLSRISNNKWSLFNSGNKNFLATNQISGITKHPNGDILFSVYGMGVAAYNSQKGWRIYDKNNSIIPSTYDDIKYEAVASVKVDKTGKIWAPVALKNITVFNLDGTGKTINNNLVKQNLSCTAFDSTQNYWIGGLNSPDYYDVIDTSGRSLKYLYSYANFNSSVYDIQTDKNNVVWVGTGSGLYRFSRDSLSTGIWTKYLEGEKIRAIAFAPATASINSPLVWVASYNKGVILLNNNGDTLQTFTKDNSGLVNNKVTGLFFEETTGLLWITTLNGISSFRTEIFTPNNNFGNTTIVRNKNYFEFDFLPDFSKIYIYTIDGRIVKNITAISQRNVRWYYNNNNNRRINPGIYYYTIQTKEKTKKGKLLVRP